MAKRTVNKTAFVMMRGKSESAAEVVAAAKAAGFKLSEKYVYNIRAKAKAAGKLQGARRRRKSLQALAEGSGETQILNVIAEYGTARVRAVLGRVETSAAVLVR